ncbi:nose resistant to fluoxetine protein 6-like [Hetaerina americana]|uniref:nose resistant to fluoxetine protein 6-like n=1 Tax=Hetaerina americana TaxID=62018 RepID=UPI003A7F3006
MAARVNTSHGDRHRTESRRGAIATLAGYSCIAVLLLSNSSANGEVIDPRGGVVTASSRVGWVNSEARPHHHIASIKLYSAVVEALGHVGGPGCRNSSRDLITDLGNFTLWAVQMFDASAKFPGGYVSGNYYRLGDFDECLGVQVDAGEEVLRGQYCLARLHLEENEKARKRRLHQRAPETPPLDPYALTYPPKSSAWETIEFKGDRSKHRKDWVHWAFCIPSFCTAHDLERALQRVIPEMGEELGMDIDISVDPKLCQVETSKPWNMLDYAFCALVGTMILLSSSATFLDIYLGPSSENIRKDKGMAKKSIEYDQAKDIPRLSFMTNLLLCFSVKNNLIHLPRKRENVGGLNVMFGIRFISTISVMISHKFIHVLLGPLQNSIFVEENNRNPLHACFLHGDLVVDTFFTSGAFLLVYFLMKELERKNHGIFMIYVFRYMRLTPVFMFLVFFYSTLLNKIGSGPLWEKIIDPERERCWENWWTNMIYVNNYVNPERMCMSHSWYLPCDTHMFALSVPLILLLKSRPRIGIILLSIAAILSAVIPAIITLTKGLDATLLIYLE